jgi:enoyl-CoA hydratase/carnithine racemase
MGVILERSGAAAVIVLDWPDRRNALGPEEAAEVSSTIRSAATDPEICGIVITGNGAFCAGGNLRAAAAREGMSAEERRQVVYSAYQGLIRAVVEAPVPTVAAIDGAAVGMGFDLSLACDARFVGPDGWAQQGWGRVGLVAATGGVMFLRRLAPGALWQMLETQDRLDARTLSGMGLAVAVNEGSARTRAATFVNALAAASRPALEAYVALDREDLRRNLDSHLALAVDHQVKLLASPDFAKRVSQVLG